MLSYGELYGGLDWLGLKLGVGAMKELFAFFDVDKDNYVSEEEFRVGLLGEDGEEETQDGMGMGMEGAEVIPDGIIPKLEGGTVGEVVDPLTAQIPSNVIGNIKVKAKACGNFKCVWTSKGSMSRQKASVWKPVLDESLFRANKALVCVGHYAGSGYDSPSKDGASRIFLEVTDMSTSRMGGSAWLPVALNKFLPHPARYRQVWGTSSGERGEKGGKKGSAGKEFYGWEPIPPNENFVALGMVGGRGDEPPKREEVRCVPRNWLVQGSESGVRGIWTDSGGGGRSGSIWTVNSMNCIKVVVGHDPPGVGYELKSGRFLLRQFL